MKNLRWLLTIVALLVLGTSVQAQNRPKRPENRPNILSKVDLKALQQGQVKACVVELLTNPEVEEAKSACKTSMKEGPVAQKLVEELTPEQKAALQLMLAKAKEKAEDAAQARVSCSTLNYPNLWEWLELCDK